MEGLNSSGALYANTITNNNIFMKKIYFLIALAAVILSANSFSASARETQLRTPQALTKPAGKVCTPKLSLPDFNKGERTLTAMRKADGNNSIEGTWTFTFLDWYFKDSTMGYVSGQFDATVNGEDITFTPLAPDDYYEMKALMGEETVQGQKVPVFYFIRASLGKEGDYYMYQVPFIYNWDANQIQPIGSIIGYYDPEDGTVAFEESNGIAWGAFSDAAGNNPVGQYYDMLDLIVANQYDFNESILGEWKELGMATIVDGWLQPGYGYNQFENQYQAPIEQKVGDENIYRIVNPFKYGVMAEYNQSTKDGYIVFDVTDPNHVLFLTADAGFSSLEDGLAQFYAYNQLGSLHSYYPSYSLAEIIRLQTGFTPWTTYKDGIVRLGALETSQGKAYDANYGFQLAPFGGYIWIDENNKQLDMTAMILFPGANGVEGIETENDSEALYFNLQGIRVLNPEAGQILIKRQGSKSSKVIF